MLYDASRHISRPASRSLATSTSRARSRDSICHLSRAEKAHEISAPCCPAWSSGSGELAGIISWRENGTAANVKQDKSFRNFLPDVAAVLDAESFCAQPVTWQKQPSCFTSCSKRFATSRAGRTHFDAFYSSAQSMQGILTLCSAS